MVTFVCYNCDVTLKKNQLEKHAFSCRPAKFICIDCSKTFEGNDYKLHVSCMTEEQKYHGQYAKQSKQQQPQLPKTAPQQQQTAVSTPKPETKKETGKNLPVEEAPEKSNNWIGWKKTIKKILKSKPKKVIKLNKLKELACKKYQESYPEESIEDIHKIFDEKIISNSKVTIVSEPYVKFTE